jgi:hypothetical protein
MMPLDMAVWVVFHIIKVAVVLGTGAALMTYLIYGRPE